MAANNQSLNTFLTKFLKTDFPKTKKFTASQFAEIWSHFDTDANGFIEGTELDNFLREFISTTLDICPTTFNEEMLKDLKHEFMREVDENLDNKIEMSEMAKFLPTDENFLLLFRKDIKLDSSVDFMRVWKRFDRDCSGFIEADELKLFLEHLMKQCCPQEMIVEERIIEYTSTMLQLFDTNRDGKLQLSEMSRLLPVKENYLCRPIFKNASNITSKDIDNIFDLYDKNRSGTIENDELHGFLKDLLELAQEDYDEEDLVYFKHIILEKWDVNHDGMINRQELKLLLLQQSSLTAPLPSFVAPAKR